MIEAYMMVDVEGTGTATLHRILKAGNALLEVEEVDRKPFIAFCPLPIPHSFYGSNFADKLCATQNARTVLTRSILDHAMITNNPRYMVTKGGLTKPARAYRQPRRRPGECDQARCNRTYAPGTAQPVRLPDPRGCWTRTQKT